MTFKYFLAKLIKKIQLPAVKNCNIDKTARVCSGSNIINVDLDKYSYIGNFCTVVNTEIGKFCSIADNCILGGANHPINWVSTSPVFHKGKNIMNKNFATHEFTTNIRTVIGNDVWIGNNVLVKGGVTIGNGSIIGMGSVVTKNIGDFEIWAGNPAKCIRKRFDDMTIDYIKKSSWWNLDNKQLTKHAKMMNNTSEFIKEIRSYE